MLRICKIIKKRRCARRKESVSVIIEYLKGMDHFQRKQVRDYVELIKFSKR